MSRVAESVPEVHGGAGDASIWGTLGPWGQVATVASLALLSGGLIWPGAAEVLFRVLVVGLALGFLARRGLEGGLPTARVEDAYSPFDGSGADRTPPAAPEVLLEAGRPLSALDDPSRARTASIPWPVARRLIHEATRRLEEGHGLRPDRPTDARRIRAQLSEPTRTLLGLDEPPGRAPLYPEDRIVPLSRLDQVLDDLEGL